MRRWMKIKSKVHKLHITPIKMKTKRKRCCNCIFASDPFKVAGKTHYTCTNQALYPAEKMREGEISAWDTLREFWESCGKHEFKTDKPL